MKFMKVDWKDRANVAKKRADAAHEIAAQTNTLFAPNLSHRKETTSKEVSGLAHGHRPAIVEIDAVAVHARVLRVVAIPAINVVLA